MSSTSSQPQTSTTSTCCSIMDVDKPSEHLELSTPYFPSSPTATAQWQHLAATRTTITAQPPTSASRKRQREDNDDSDEQQPNKKSRAEAVGTSNQLHSQLNQLTWEPHTAFTSLEVTYMSTPSETQQDTDADTEAPCPICYETVLSSPLESDEDNWRLTRDICRRLFHEACMAKWIQFCRESRSPATCPMCRGVISEPEPESGDMDDLLRAAAAMPLSNSRVEESEEEEEDFLGAQEMEDMRGILSEDSGGSVEGSEVGYEDDVGVSDVDF